MCECEMRGCGLLLVFLLLFGVGMSQEEQGAGCVFMYRPTSYNVGTIGHCNRLHAT